MLNMTTLVNESERWKIFLTLLAIPCLFLPAYAQAQIMTCDLKHEVDCFYIEETGLICETTKHVSGTYLIEVDEDKKRVWYYAGEHIFSGNLELIDGHPNGNKDYVARMQDEQGEKRTEFLSFQSKMAHAMLHSPQTQLMGVCSPGTRYDRIHIFRLVEPDSSEVQ